MQTEIYDIENWKNFFSYASYNVDTEQKNFFVIHESRNDLEKFYNHYSPDKRYVGFKNSDYDSQLCHFIWHNYKYIKDFDIRDLLSLIRDENNRVINTQWSQPIGQHEQVDLYKIHHFDNKNKRTSLKWVQCVLGLENVQDLPFDLDYEVKTEDIPLIEAYNQDSDVKSTTEFYYKTLPMIKLREQFKEKFKIDCLNYSDPKIGSELMLKLYCERTGKDPSYIRNLRTYRDKVHLKDILLPNYDFRFKGFQQLYIYLLNKTIRDTKEDLHEKVFFRGTEIAYGCGGFHGCCEPGVYDETDEWGIYDIDAASLYPYFNILYKGFPLHLGPIFCDIMKDNADQRIRVKKTDPVESDGLKLALNGSVGNMNSQYSFLYDPQAFLNTTINCQLLLTKLAEDIIDKVPSSKLLQLNTDGITFLLRKSDVELFRKAYHQWEIETRFTLEEATFKRMVIRDVNNYLAIKHDGTTKEKGCFEIEKKVGSAIAYNKNHGKKIVRRALREYYTKGTPVEQYIKSEPNPIDFLIHSKTKEGDKHLWDDVKQQKTLRYYVSKTGKPLYKILKPLERDGALDRYRKNIPNQMDIFSIIPDDPKAQERKHSLEAGYTCKIMNKLSDEHDINHEYYIKEANKIIQKCN